MSEIKCPKCGSTQIHADKRGFKTGRAVAGTLIAGPLVGLATGGAGKNKIVITCLGCGHQFKPGESSYLHSSSSTSYSGTMNYPDGVTFVPQERANYKCSHCGKVSSFAEVNKRCPSCGGYIKESDRVGYVNPNPKASDGNLSVGAVLLIIAVFILLVIIIATCS